MKNNNIVKLNPSNVTPKMRKYLEEKNYDDETIKGLKKRGFVCRLPYPITLSVLIDISERMGIMNEEKVLAGLYNLREELNKNIQEIPKD